MNARHALAAALAAAAFASAARADIGAPVHDQLTRIEQSRQFAGVPVDHGPLPDQHLQRWKFETSHDEGHVFTVDGKSESAPVVRETFVRMTQVDPYSLQPAKASGRFDLVDVLSVAEYGDFQKAAALTPIPEPPRHLVAYFYRGRLAAYEVLEPVRRTYGSPDRFEWRSFPLTQLDAAMKAARACDNGEDCAAWF
jgi:hypothetical protein